MKTVNAKTNVVHAVALPAGLELCAAQIAGALQEKASLSETLGALTIEAGRTLIKAPDLLDPFMDACRQMCGSVGLTEGSFKVYMSNIRGVIRAMILTGYKPKAGQSLRSMYDAAPKGTGREKVQPKTGARPNDGAKATDDSDGVESELESLAGPGQAKKQTAAESRHAAVVTLFGHVDDELLAAISWAAQHELRFVNLIKAQIAFDSKPVAAPLKKAA